METIIPLDRAWSPTMTPLEIGDIPEAGRVRALYDEVSTMAGQPVRIAVVADHPAMVGAEAASTTDGGAPQVLISPGWVTAMNVCHELLHLRCEYSGFPRTNLTFDPAAVNTPVAWSEADGIRDIGSIVEHRVIYPKMEALGFDPIADVERKLRQRTLPSLQEMRDLAARGGLNESGRMNLATTSARVLLEVKDLAIRKEFLAEKTWFVQDFARGSKIAKRIAKTGTTPNACRIALLAALDICGIPRGAYTLRP